MADYRRNEIVSGLFVVSALAVFALFAFRVGNVDAFGILRADRVTCVAYFADIKTLDEGAKVSVAGRRVGSVVALDLVDQALDAADVERLEMTHPGAYPGLVAGMRQARVRVEFALEDPALRFDADTAYVALDQDGFLGRHYLEFYPGHWSAADAPPGIFEMPDAVHEVAVTEGGGLEALLASVQPAVQRVDDILASLQTQVFDGRGVEAARSALASLADAVRGAATLLDSEDPAGVHSLVLRPLNELLGSANGSIEDLRARLIAPAGELLARGPSLVDGAQRVLDQAGGMLEDSRPQVASVLGQLDQATRDLDGRLNSVQSEVEALLVAVRGTVETTSPEIAETARRLRRAMWQAEMAARKIRANPAFLLFGDEESDLEAQPQDRSDVWRGGRAKPYGQRDEGDGE